MADKLGVTVDYFLYQVSTQAEVKAISVQLTDKDSEYVLFRPAMITTNQTKNWIKNICINGASNVVL
jgi:hypothetical protein